MKSTQISLHHSKAATAILCQQLAEGMADVVLIQEPWIYRDQVRVIMNSGGTTFSAAPEGNAKSCIYGRNHINALPLLEFCSRDASTVRMKLWGAHHCSSLPSIWLRWTTANQGTKGHHWLLPQQEKATNSSLGLMLTHPTYYGGAPAPIPEERTSWNIWWVQTWIFLIKKTRLPLRFTIGKRLLTWY
jgi:hypothetical protein